jgi:hypothetical protein
MCPLKITFQPFNRFLLAAHSIYDYTILSVNFALKEHPLVTASYIGQSKLFLPYQRHTASEIHSLKSFLTNKSVSNVGKLTLFVQRAVDPLNLSLPQVFASRPILVFGAQ